MKEKAFKVLKKCGKVLHIMASVVLFVAVTTCTFFVMITNVPVKGMVWLLGKAEKGIAYCANKYTDKDFVKWAYRNLK